MKSSDNKSLTAAFQDIGAESRSWLDTILKASRNGILLISADGKIIDANARAGEILGKDPGMIKNSPIIDIIADAELTEVIKTGGTIVDQTFACGDKQIRVTCLSVQLKEAALGAVCVIDDTTRMQDMTKELEALRETNKELEGVFNSSYDGIWVLDGNGLILKVNNASERITGQPTKMHAGRNIRKLIEHGLIDQSATLKVIEEKVRTTIIQTIQAVDREKTLLVTATPIFDEHGQLFRIVTNNRDISELVDLRDQLLKEKEQSRKYMEEMFQLRKMQGNLSGLIFRSKAMQQIVEMSSWIANVDSTVLITGDSGTGKEMVARLIYRLGKENKKPFITVNCGAIPDTLLESELFGYEGGAFTGAKRDGKPGMFEMAHSGILFLDEIGELPMILQVKLLRALQEKEVYRVGGTRPIPVDVRIIAATNKDLGQLRSEKKFREDLYYRLMVVPIYIPPLRERKDDIPPLTYHFVDVFNQHFGLRKTISSQVMDKLIHYDWPGNVRELKNVIERMIVMSRGSEVVKDDLPDFIQAKRPLPKIGSNLRDAVRETEIYLLSEAFKVYGSWPKVAEALRVNYTTVFRKASKYRLMQRP